MNVTVPPASVVISPLVGVIVKLGISLDIIEIFWLKVAPKTIPVEGLLIVRIAISFLKPSKLILLQ